MGWRKYPSSPSARLPGPLIVVPFRNAPSRATVLTKGRPWTRVLGLFLVCHWLVRNALNPTTLQYPSSPLSESSLALGRADRDGRPFGDPPTADQPHPTTIQHVPTLSIGIFVAADRRSQQLYDANLQSIRCYGQRHGYDVIITDIGFSDYPNENESNNDGRKQSDRSSNSVLVTQRNRTIDLSAPGVGGDDNNDDDDSDWDGHSCSSITSFSFRRQCIVARVLRHYDFLVVLDADCGVANANRTIESILWQTSISVFSTPALSAQLGGKTDMNNSTVVASVIHEERFHTGEVMAAAYIVKNNIFARNYLRRWGGYYRTLPDPEFNKHDNATQNNHNARQQYVNKFYHNQRDNPALNLVFLEALSRLVANQSNITLQHHGREEKTGRDVPVSLTSIAQHEPPSLLHHSLIDECHKYWKLSRGNRRYMAYLDCVQRGIARVVEEGRSYQAIPPPNNDIATNMLDGTTVTLPSIQQQSPLYLFRRGHGGLGRDVNTCNGMVSPIDVFVHNLKGHSAIIKHATGFYTERPTCEDGDGQPFKDWQAPVDPKRWLSVAQMKALMKTPACLAKVTKIGECWPDCTL